MRATPTDTAPATAFPRPPTHSSVPSLLSALQNEYDAMVFETLALKKQHDAVRQELAHALYTNDASMRVIARLMKERDEAREALASVHRSLGVPTDDVEMSAAGALPDDTVASIEAKASECVYVGGADTDSRASGARASRTAHPRATRRRPARHSWRLLQRSRLCTMRRRRALRRWM